MIMNDSLQLNMFFPSELLSITSVDFDDSSIHIKMQSKTHSCNSGDSVIRLLTKRYRLHPVAKCGSMRPL